MNGESQNIDTLLADLNHPDKAEVRKAMDALILLTRKSPDLALHLEMLLPKAGDEKRWPIAYVLGHASQPSSLTIKVLLDCLGSGDPDIRWAVSQLLARLGKHNAQVAELLLDLLRSGTPTQRRMAIYCLREFDLEKRLTTALLQALDDPEPLVRVAAATALKGQGEIAVEGTDSLINILLCDADTRVRCAAAMALAHLENPTTNARAALEEAAQSANLRVQKASRAALQLLQKKEPVPPTR